MRPHTHTIDCGLTVEQGRDAPLSGMLVPVGEWGVEVQVLIIGVLVRTNSTWEHFVELTTTT